MRRGRVVMVAVAELGAADSPRSAVQSATYTRALAKTFHELPPIIVHRPTMRVIDGMHRLRAAYFLGLEQIQARFFDGGEIEAFALAVKANLSGGLPLSPTERRAAARRLVVAVPHWSDLRIADATGLTTTDVSVIRGLVHGEGPEARRNQPQAKGRPPRELPDERNRSVDSQRRENRSAMLQHLANDPALRFSNSGKTLLRRLHPALLGPDLASTLAATTPAHCAELAAALAAACAHDWRTLSIELARRGRATA